LLLHHNNTPRHPFSPGNFLIKRSVTVVPKPTPLFSGSPIEEKPKNLHSNTIEVIEAELQAMLNTLTEHGFQNPFFKMAEDYFFESDSGQWAQN
jgi:hypothetical protein